MRLRGSRVFRNVVEEFIADREPKWRRSTVRQYRDILLVYWQPLHWMELNAVTRNDIAVTLRRIERDRGTRSAALARTRLSTLYVWAMGQGLIETNPVIGTTKIEYTVKRERALNDDELARVWQACSRPESFPNGGSFGRVVKVIILLGARRQEITGMKWSELDLAQATWTLPAERSKNRRAHTLPLSPAVLTILDEISREPQAPEAYVFTRFGRMDAYRPLKTLQEQSGVYKWWVHDLRRTAATGMANLGIAPHVIECVLNHVSGFRGGVAGIYNRSTYEREVADALLRWSTHVTALGEGRPSNVVTLRGAK
jgi:integrase